MQFFSVRDKLTLVCYEEKLLIKNNRNILRGERVEPKYLIHSYQEVTYGEKKNRVWHIHGEARKPNSMILGHYYYATLLQRIVAHVNERQASYSVEGESIEIKSWIDSFIMGNVYILGFGMDYSEMDLWWLLNRKKREKAEHGKVVFYASDFDQEKNGLLELLDVEVRFAGMGRRLTNKTDQYYKSFYRNAIAEIIREVNNN